MNGHFYNVDHEIPWIFHICSMEDNLTRDPPETDTPNGDMMAWAAVEYGVGVDPDKAPSDIDKNGGLTDELQKIFDNEADTSWYFLYKIYK